MPRKRELTWQPGSGARPGRWRKKFGAKSYYFSGGRGKTDQLAYEAALNQWATLKEKIRAHAPKRHQADYESEINIWNQVLAWSKQNDDRSSFELARDRINRLKFQLASAEPKPVT